jgi:hypothetical protein
MLENSNEPTNPKKKIVIDLDKLSIKPPALDNPQNLPADSLRKMDPRMRMRYEEGELAESLHCIGRVAKNLSDDDKKALAAAGAKLNAEIGTIITVQFPKEKLKEVLALPFLQELDGGTPLYPGRA